MKVFSVERTAIIDSKFEKELLNLEGSNSYSYVVSRHEYFVCQLVAIVDYNKENFAVETFPLVGEKDENKKAVVCFNTDNGKARRTLKVVAKKPLPLFFGIDFSKAQVGSYITKISLDGEIVTLKFTVTDELVFNEGADYGASLARLKWLHSNRAVNKATVKGYDAISTEKNTLSFTGKKVAFATGGMIDNVESHFTESNAIDMECNKSLFYRPMEFLIQGQKVKYNRLKISNRFHTATLASEGKSDSLRVEVRATARYEGYLEYAVKLIAEKDVVIPDVALVAHYACTRFVAFNGKIGKPNAEEKRTFADGVMKSTLFAGDVNCGAVIRMKSSDKQTLVSPYNCVNRDVPVDGWDNHGKGYTLVMPTDEGLEFSAHTGRIVLVAGAEITFNFEIYLTPFKALDMKKSFGTRVGQDNVERNYSEMIDRAANDKMHLLNVQYGTKLYNIVNYPFDRVRELKNISLEAHKKGIGVSIDYTLGEIPDNNIEANIYTNIDGMTTVCNDKKVRLIGDGVAGNYYVESLQYLISNVGLNGVTALDPSFNRNLAERVNKVLDRKTAIPRAFSLVMSDRANEANGNTLSVIDYVSVLPFVDKMMKKEVMDYKTINLDEKFLLYSGVPFGVSAESADGSSIVESMLYAMTTTYGKDGTVSEALSDLYKEIDAVGISESNFKGCWDSLNPVRVDNKSILCSSYINGGKMVAVFFNTSDKKIEFEVGIENKLGYTTVGKKVYAPQIAGLQKKKKVNLGKPFKLKAHGGLIVIVK